MLSDEEEILIKKLSYCEQEYEQNGYLSVGKFEAIKEAVNLIKKQSKEIEELKQDRDEYKEEYIKLQNARYYNYISKDKIKAKVEDILNSENGEAIEKLIEWQSLLEKE